MQKIFILLLLAATTCFAQEIILGDPTEPSGPARPDYWIGRHDRFSPIRGEVGEGSKPRQVTKQFNAALTDSYTFYTNVRVNDNPAGTSFESPYSSGAHAIAARGDTVYLVWRSDRLISGGGKTTIYFDKSVDGGNTWGTDVRITDSDSAAIMPALAVGKDGTIYVSWTDFRDASGYRHIYFAKSTNGGGSFGASVRVCYDHEYSQAFSSIAVNDSGYIYISFDDYRNLAISAIDVYCAISKDSGNTFSPAIKINDNSDSTDQKHSSIAVGNTGLVCATWQDRRNQVSGGPTRNRYDVYSTVSNNSGNTFNTNVRVNERDVTDSMDRWESSVAIDDSGIIYVAFENWLNTNEDIYFTKSIDGGSSFVVPNNNLIDAVGESYTQGYPSLACDDSGGVYCAWQDYRDDYNNAHKIYMNYSKNYGDSFRLNNLHVDDQAWQAATVSEYVTLCSNSRGKLHAAWMDTRNGGYDIYTTAGSFTGVEGKPEESILLNRMILKTYPNPFNNLITIKYGLTAKSRVNLSIYNIAGQKVKTVITTQKDQGQNSIIWNGRDDKGNKVSAGVYLLCLELNNKVTTQKITLIK